MTKRQIIASDEFTTYRNAYLSLCEARDRYHTEDNQENLNAFIRASGRCDIAGNHLSAICYHANGNTQEVIRAAQVA